jgi:hypothetical protein
MNDRNHHVSRFLVIAHFATHMDDWFRGESAA